MALVSKLGIESGTIGTIAGIGEPGAHGDGGLAIHAALSEPKSVALAVASDEATLFIADADNHLIRRVDLTTGRITTVAGCPSEARIEPSRAEPDPAVPSEDDPLGEPVGETKFTQLSDLRGTVRFVVGQSPIAGRFTGDGSLGLKATLNFPSAVAGDRDGNLYIADTMNHRVRKVDGRTGNMTTIAGTGQARWTGDGGPGSSAALNEPAALAIYGDELYIADQSNNRIRRLSLVSGRIQTVAGTGEATYTGDGMPATEAALAGPSGLAMGPDGTLYIADTFNGRIRGVDPATGRISTIAGDGATYRYQAANEFSTSLSRPYGIALDPDGNILITDSDSHLIRRWDRRRKIITVVAGDGVARFGGDGGPPQASSLNYPFGVAVDREGNIYIADTFNHRVRVVVS
jgi:sugar lactone lactonase YvrE